MKYIKGYKNFNEEFVLGTEVEPVIKKPEVSPGRPSPIRRDKPSVEPDTKASNDKPTVKPGVKPEVRPGRPSPIRRDKPSVEPDTKATVEDVANKFISLMNERGEDIKKYIKK